MEQGLAHVLGAQTEGPALAVLFALLLLGFPIVLLTSAAAFTAWITGERFSALPGIAAGYWYALIPLGVGVWLAHYGFHWLTGGLTVIPVVQSVALELLGWAALGSPQWQLTGMRPGTVFPIEVGVIVLGAFGSLALAYLISERDHFDRPVAATVPWALVAVTIAVAAIWITAQPMDMRAVVFPG